MDAVEGVSELIALGLGLEQKTFTNSLQGGPHLLAPTGSDLQKFDVGSIFAGFHYGNYFGNIEFRLQFHYYSW